MTVCEQVWERTERKLLCVLRWFLVLLNHEAEPSPSQMLAGNLLFESLLAISCSFSAFSAASCYLFSLTKWEGRNLQSPAKEWLIFLLPRLHTSFLLF